MKRGTVQTMSYLTKFRRNLLSALLFSFLCAVANCQTVVLDTKFNLTTKEEGFTYADNRFRNTVGNTAYAAGSWNFWAGRDGALQVTLGGSDDKTVTTGSSGGWARSFTASQTKTVTVTISLTYFYDMAKEWTDKDYSEVLVSIDGQLIGTNGNDYIVRRFGKSSTPAPTSYQIVVLNVILSPGAHVLAFGGFINQKKSKKQITEIYFDSVTITTVPNPPTPAPVKAPVPAPVPPPIAKAPVPAPTAAPVPKLPPPTSAPIAKAPVPTPTTAPIPKLPPPTLAPVAKAPVPTPTTAPVPKLPPPTLAPVAKAPVPTPTTAPVLVPSPTSAPVATTSSTAIRINTGGSAHTDPATGNVWMADAYYGDKGFGYGSCDQDILNTTLDDVYCINRWYGGPGNLVYEIPLPSNGDWEIRLMFAELYFTGPNQRKFNVYIDGSLVLNQFDVYVAAGGSRAALMIPFTKTISDGFATIEFIGVVDNPIINGIEIVPATGSPTPPLVLPTPPPVPPTLAPVSAPTSAAIRINAGGGQYTDPSGNLWMADNYFGNKGIGYGSCGSDILGTTLDEVYCYNRWHGGADNLIYEMPIANGEWEIRLMFAEIYFTSPNQRKFSIMIEDTLVVNDLDVVQSVGARTALVVPFTTTISDGAVTIKFIKNLDNPIIDGIEIVPATGPPSPPATTAPTPTLAPASPPTSAAIRINAGGGQYTDPSGNTWLADSYFGNKGYGYGSCGSDILGTTLDVVYCYNRWYDGADNLVYEIPVADGNWEIRLMFAEIYFTSPNQRKFSVVIEDIPAINNLDVVQSVGARTALVIPFTTTISDGAVTIKFIKILDNPIINGIEIVPATGPLSPPATNAPTPTLAPVSAPTSAALRINAGGGQYTDPSGNLWMADNYFGNKGFVYWSCGSDILGTTFDEVYCINRWYGGADNLIYEIPVANGNWEIRLMFAETFFTASNKRRFSVLIEDMLAIDKLDIFKSVGARTALMIPFTAAISDGAVTIKFVMEIDNPMISGIEIIPATGPLSQPVTLAPTVAPVLDGSILINCGGLGFTEQAGTRVWQADQYFHGGNTYVDGSSDIEGTDDDILYISERNGNFYYSIPADIATYEVNLHFAELYWAQAGDRVFDIDVEGRKFTDFDIIAYGGKAKKKVTLVTVALVEDGFLTITMTQGLSNFPKLSGIEVKPLELHTAHAVPQGPYVAVDINNTGSVAVFVDGSTSHTHGLNQELTSFVWRQGATVLATFMSGEIILPVGEHTLSLTVTDSSGNSNTDSTTATVYPYGYPAITALSDNQGSISGGNSITISGSGFNYPPSQIKVRFGLVELTGDDITVQGSNTIAVNVPPSVLAVPVAVTVETPLATSNSFFYTYIAGMPIDFISSELYSIDGPTRGTFGPDGRLYIGTLGGKLARLTLNDDFTQVVSAVVSTVANFRFIGGIAFDPMDNNEPFPPVYISHSYLFHGEWQSSSGEAINGKISRVTGANLDQITHIVTGLPVSDHDHAVTGITFGDRGELYINVASNTNAGLPGPLTGKQLQKENYYSSATLVAHLARPDFNGAITYDALDDGTPNGGSGIEVFAPGRRNSLGIVLHSNGYLYSTDNGPNGGYGAISTGCGPNEFAKEYTTKDKLCRLVQGGYYGSPNRKRAAVDNDPRQCVFHPATETSTADYTAPLMPLTSSTNGMIEYAADHFDGQLRGNLIASKFNDGLFRIILSPDGKSVIPQSNPAIAMLGDHGLDVTQAPDGSLIEVRIETKNIYIHKPNEANTSTDLKVNSVFPRRGGTAGGYNLSVYGVNLSSDATVMVNGTTVCPIVSRTGTSKIVCTMPGGPVGTVDIVVSGSSGSYTFKRGFRYITGVGS